MIDLIGENKKSNEQLKAKKWMKIIGVLLVFLFLVCIALIYLVYYIQSTQLKITLDGVATNKLEQVLIFEENNIYVPIRDFASYVGYSSYNGDIYSEDATKCYVKNANETASFSLNSNKIYKTTSGNDYEYYEIDEPVKLINEKLYTTIQGAKIAFNIQFNYNKDSNSVTILTLPYLVNYYAAKFSNSALVDNTSSFNNQKALLYNMIVIKNEYNNYGVNTLNNTEIIGTKYTSIEFIESTMEFVVTTAENKMGIISYDSTTKIRPEYDRIKQIDKDSGLYLATNNGKNGIIDSNGNIVLYLEYDQIGINSASFKTNKIKNQYLLYDTCIPVKRNGLWGMYDKNGQQVLETKYTALGCTVGNRVSGDNTANNILLIPEYNAIVVQEGQYYGLVNVNGEKLIPSALSSVYSVTTSGKENYYMIYKEQVINVIDYLKKQENAETNNNIQENTQNNNPVNNQQSNPENNGQMNSETNQTINQNGSQPVTNGNITNQTTQAEPTQQPDYNNVQNQGATAQ